MNRFLQTALFSLCFLAVAGCAGGKAPAQADLLHRRFVLESVDGQPFVSKQSAPDIEFGENFRVYGRVCNRYTGQGELSGGVLTVKQMASTKMLCLEEALNAFEHQFAQMLAAGAAVDLSGNRLTLKGDGRVLVYRLQN